MKNPHAVALGRLGGAKGGKARAQALSASRRREIAQLAGAARARSLSASERQESARRAVQARWSRTPRIVTAQQAPPAVRRLLKSYDPAALRWAKRDHRYTVVREILLRGDESAKRWLGTILSAGRVRDLVRAYRGAGSNEPDRARLRNQLGLSGDDIPVRPFVGLRWRRLRT
jgi:hypothetical protein